MNLIPGVNFVKNDFFVNLHDFTYSHTSSMTQIYLALFSDSMITFHQQSLQPMTKQMSEWLITWLEHI